MRTPWIVFALTVILGIPSAVESAEFAVPSAMKGPGRSISNLEPANPLRISLSPTSETWEIPDPTFGLLPDFKKQAIPKNFRKMGTENRDSPPKLDPLIDQLIRHAELESSSAKILPWVYGTSTEMVVADFEEALTRIELAGVELELATYRAVFDVGSIKTDPHLIAAIAQLDVAEFTILMLVEMAKLEL